jgi:DNA polymerase-1
MLFHNGRFDTEVARVWMGLPYPEDPTYIEDTLFLNYLYDPNADSLSLKPSATRILGIEPTEQQKLQGYLASIGYNGKEWGAHISKAPAEIVGPYAIGDVYRTHRLYEHLIRIIEQRGMLDAYRREQRLAPILSANEADGIRVDLDNLERDHVIAEKALIEVGKRLKALIGVDDPTPSGLVSALVASGRVRQEDFLLTPTGQLSTAKESLDIAVKDEELRQVLQYRANLKTILSTFMRPWLEKGTANKGRLHPEWNQVRGEVYGTRTGRLSSSNPNFQNIPTEFKVAAPAGLPPLPFMRRYILPDEGQIIVTSDFNGQEMRIASHFAEGRAAEIYRNDPGADFHAVVAGILKEEAGIALPHKDVKITGFSLLYGSGTRALAQLLGVDTETAKRIKKHYFDALPGFKELMDEVSARGRSGLPVKTWGGRLLHAETAMINGRLVNFAYKLTNYLVQGSAADQTKEAVITAGYKKRDKRFLATVHDENVYSVDPDYLASNVLDIKQSMELQEGWDVPFKAKVKVGPNWWDIEDYNG